MNPQHQPLWEVCILPTALRKLQIGPPTGLPSAAAFAALELINGPLSRNPHQVGKSLHGGLAGKRAARRGDYHVIYLIDNDKHLVTVFDVGHRGHVYRRN